MGKKFKYCKPLKYILTEEYSIDLSSYVWPFDQLDNHEPLNKMVNNIQTPCMEIHNGILSLYKHFQWNGASGPVRDSKKNMRASLVHDALYTIFYDAKAYRKSIKIADNIFRDICIEDGVNKLVANSYYAGLRVFNLFR